MRAFSGASRKFSHQAARRGAARVRLPQAACTMLLLYAVTRPTSREGRRPAKRAKQLAGPDSHGNQSVNIDSGHRLRCPQQPRSTNNPLANNQRRVGTDARLLLANWAGVIGLKFRNVSPHARARGRCGTAEKRRRFRLSINYAK